MNSQSISADEVLDEQKQAFDMFDQMLAEKKMLFEQFTTDIKKLASEIEELEVERQAITFESTKKSLKDCRY